MNPRIAIVGGGLAGLAAAVALAGRGLSIELFEAKRRLGGRAGSYLDRHSGEEVDHCQHVVMGCCTNYLDFARRTGITDLFERHRQLHFFGADGRRSDFRPAKWLPAPLHLAPALLAIKHLSLADKLAIAQAMLRLLRAPAVDLADAPTVLQWLHKQCQPSRVIERFWQVVLVSALGESLDRASLSAARKVFLDGFLAHPDACDVLVPRVPLSQLYERVADWLRERGVVLRLESPVKQVDRQAVQLVGGTAETCDCAILAVPWRRVADIISPALPALHSGLQAAAEIAGSPISGVHLWFDRPITHLPHAVLVGRLSQWVFARKRPAAKDHYYQVVISASHDLAGRDRQAVIEEVLADLQAVFRPAGEATLLRWQLITEQDAVFSVRPGLDEQRPPQQTPVPGLLLAGDWTRTGWPATMEGAVRSGYLAAEAALASIGRPDRLLVPDLPRGWLVKGLGARD